jgi:fructose-specific component phosphotransferase system IIB-like protein
VLHWWQEIQSKSDTGRVGQAVVTFFSRVSWIVIALGVIAGMTLASALLHYDGSQPINVLVLLVFLILIPLLLFLLSLMLPVLSSSSTLSGLNAGSMVFSVLKNKSPALQAFFSSSRSDHSKDILLRWRLMLYSQQFGLALAVSALLVLLARVSFSDLAFGWSTTLDIEASTLTPWVQGLAGPWAAWFPDAVPSSSLIEQSRFFRLDSGVSKLSAQALTAWWKFVAMCLVVYGIGFRLLALWFASFNYKQATIKLLMQHSEVTALLDRFDAPLGSGQAQVSSITAESAASNDASNYDIQNADLVICWNGALPNGKQVQHKKIIRVGGEHALQKSDELLNNQNTENVRNIHIFTKAWEPPLLEFHDFIKTLRKNFGNNTSISIQPIAAENSARNKTDLEIWRHSLEKLQDSKVYVV